jgi:flagellar hook-associated protein 2
MVAENKPMVALKDKITSKNLLISDLGTLKGKVASFQTALQSLQSPAALSELVATSSDESVVKITSSASALRGRHDIVVNQVAQPAQLTFNNFASSTANAGLVAGDAFSITIGSRTYNYTPPTGVTLATTTIENLKNWVNAIGDNLSASIVPTSGSNYALKIQGTEPGSDNSITYSRTPAAIVTTAITGTSANPSNDLAGFVSGDTFSVTSGGNTYTNSSFTNTTTIGDVQTWLSSAPRSISSSINESKQLVLANGATYSRTVSGGLGSALNRPTIIAAQDASFILDGVAFTRNTNTITDALSGTTINLVKSDAGSVHSISVNKGDDKAPEVMQGLVDAFNDLLATAKKLSAKASPSSSGSTNGSLANSPTALSFMNQIKSMLAGDIQYTLAGSAGTLSMRDLGFEMQFDGTAKFNATTFNATNNVTTILASGIKVGYSTYIVRDPVTGAEISKTTTDVNLDSYLTSLLKATTSTTVSGSETISGAFDRQIKNEQSSLAEMTKKQVALQMRLEERQKSLYSQYSALNALLYKLSITSNSLTNALSGLTNGQNNN